MASIPIPPGGPSGFAVQSQQLEQPLLTKPAGAPHGEFKQDDAKELEQLQGWHNMTDSTPFSYVPSWSDPAWREDREVEFDGTYLKERARLGDPAISMRPAILGADDIKNPTEYARRFGVHPDSRRDGWGHSRMTPTDPAFQTSQQTFEFDEYDRSLQSVTLNYNTTELVEQKAFDPRLQIPWPPDLDDPVDSLFSEDRWTQVPIPTLGEWSGVCDVRYGIALDGIGGVYDFQANQKVRDALRPALQLATKIIRSGHPYWEAMLNLYHIRPVDRAKDGRSDAERARMGGVPYSSVWMNVDNNDHRVPPPYPEMQTLKDLGFDGEAARSACLGLLDRFLRWSIYHGTQELGRSHLFQDVGRWYPQIFINATMSVEPMESIHVHKLLQILTSTYS